MIDTKFPVRESAHYAALKDAIMAEQHVLELDIWIANARIQELLGEAPCPSEQIFTALSRKRIVMRLCERFDRASAS